MSKLHNLFGLALLALAFLAPVSADAANRVWVGGTGNFSDTAHWSLTSGGAGGQTVPGSGDAVIVDNNAAGLNGGTLTVDQTVNVQSISLGTANGTINFGSNNVAVSSFVSFSGSGTRTINMGSGTWTLTTSGGGTIWDVTTTTSLVPTFQNAALVFTGATAAVRTFVGGAQTYGSLTVADNSSKNLFAISGANTFASVTIGSGTLLQVPQAATTTISGALAMNGTSSAQSGLITSNTANIATVSVGSASTITWAGIYGITRAGAGTLDATCSFDMGRNSSFTSLTFVGASCGGSGGGSHVIGSGT